MADNAPTGLRPADQLFPVPFHEDTLVLAAHNGEPYVVMRPVVESMGLNWKSQYDKLTEKFGSTVVIITTVAEDGKSREMLALPLRKFPGWLYSINPSKVAPEIAPKIVRYQDEVDEVLWKYWTEGYVARAGAKPISVAQKIALGNQRMKLLDALEKTTHPAKRRAIHDQLAATSTMMGLPVPPLEQIGRDIEPDQARELTEEEREFVWQLMQERRDEAHSRASAIARAALEGNDDASV